MKNVLTRTKYKQWMLGGLGMILSFLFMDCRSYPFGSSLGDKNGNYYRFISTLDTAYGFDRLVFLRLIVDDPDHILGGLSKWLRMSTLDQKNSIVLCDITYIRWTGQHCDIMIAFQAKTDSVILHNLVCLDFTIGSNGRKKSEKKVDFPLGQTFSLVPGAVNYLGRLQLSIAGNGPSETSIRTESNTGLFARTVSTPIRYSIQLTQDDACFREDLEKFSASDPKMSLPEDIAESPAK